MACLCDGQDADGQVVQDLAAGNAKSISPIANATKNLVWLIKLCAH